MLTIKIFRPVKLKQSPLPPFLSWALDKTLLTDEQDHVWMLVLKACFKYLPELSILISSQACNTVAHFSC
jgi:hypothetical protein